MSDQFILLPAHGLKTFQSDRLAFQALTGVGHAQSTQPPVPLGFGMPGLLPTISDQGMDSIHEDGPKLIEADMSQVEAIQSILGLRVRPLTIGWRSATAASGCGSRTPPAEALAPHFDLIGLRADGLSTERSLALRERSAPHLTCIARDGTGLDAP